MDCGETGESSDEDECLDMESSPTDISGQGISRDVYKSKKCKIELSNASNGDRIVKLLVDERKGWKLGPFKRADIKWMGSGDDDEKLDILQTKKGSIINYYPFVKTVAHKDSLKSMMDLCRCFNKEAYEFVPFTFVLPRESEEFNDYSKKRKNALYIAKPSSGSQGDNMMLFKDAKDIPNFKYNGKEFVVQRYIDNPLLINGFKFDLRIYVVVTGIEDGRMHAFLADEGLARFCTEKYSKPTKDNFRKLYMHLTNYSLNKLSDNYIEDTSVEDILKPNNATKRTLAALFQEILLHSNDPGIVDEIKKNIQKTCSSTMAVLSNMIMLHANPQTSTNPTKKAFVGTPFQIYGFDVLIDSSLKAWLLEINDHPSLNSLLCKAFMGCNHKDCPVSPVDEYVKKQVISDSIDLMIKAKRIDIENIDDRFNNMQRVFPSEDSDDQMMFESIREIRYFFLDISKGKPTLSSSDFEQRMLKSLFIVKSCGFKRVDLTLTFQKVSGKERSVEFFGFLKLLYCLKLRCETVLEVNQGKLVDFIFKLTS